MSRWRIVLTILVIAWASVMAFVAMLGMSLAFGRSWEASFHAANAGATYLATGLVLGRWSKGWLP